MSSDAPAAPKVVVVREGPSKRRPIIIDAAVGIVGLLLLMGSVALVDVLPEEPVIVPQYMATFTGNLPDNGNIIDADTGASRNSDPKYATEGNVMEWHFEFPDANIYQVTVGLRFEEDHPATLRDRFHIELESPNGTIFPYNAAGGFMYTNPVEEIPSDEPSTSPVFWRPANAAITQIAFPVSTVPADYFFTTEDVMGELGDFEPHEVEGALKALHDQPDSIGVWTVRATLEEAGDCPEPNPAALTFDHAAQCRAQTSYEKRDPATQAPPTDPNAGTTDEGNPGIVGSVSYLYFQVDAEDP